jgi:uncharacterized membrane protein YeaQ/YmgE (transglycosylase-associated protein family)
MLHILAVLFIGFFAGLLARAITPGEHRMGFFMTALLGIVGSVVASFLGPALGLWHRGQIGFFVGGVVGAFVLLVVGGMLRKMMA